MSTATKAKPKIKIHPLEDRVVILPAEEAETMRGGAVHPGHRQGKADPGRGHRRRAGPVGEGRAGEDRRRGGRHGALRQVQRHAVSRGR